MSRGVVYFCWHCYDENDAPAGPCRHCGEPIEAPPGTSYVDQLVWALDHPLTERRMIAVRVLGQRGERRAIPKLRELAEKTDDPYLAAASLQALVSICGAPALPELLERLAAVGPPQVKAVAASALARRSG